MFLYVSTYSQNNSAENICRCMQNPPGLMHANFGESLVYLHFAVSNKNLEPGFTSSSFTILPVGVRVNLIGNQLGKNFYTNNHCLCPVRKVKKM